MMSKKESDNWTEEERKRVVAVFEWLLKEDKKQNPELYRDTFVDVENPRK